MSSNEHDRRRVPFWPFGPHSLPDEPGRRRTKVVSIRKSMNISNNDVRFTMFTDFCSYFFFQFLIIFFSILSIYLFIFFTVSQKPASLHVVKHKKLVPNATRYAMWDM